MTTRNGFVTYPEFNPQLNGNHFTPAVHVPVTVYPTYRLPTGDFNLSLNPGNLAPAAGRDILGLDVADPLGIKTLADRFQQQFDTNLPNYLVGAVGLFFLFVGVTTLAAPAAVALAKATA